jgi:hypothetical protein
MMRRLALADKMYLTDKHSGVNTAVATWPAGIGEWRYRPRQPALQCFYDNLMKFADEIVRRAKKTFRNLRNGRYYQAARS